jgi:hypothetical protein
MNTPVPNPSSQKAALWVARITQEYLRAQGWQDVDERFHGIVSVGRQYAKTQFASQIDQQEAFLDGLVLGLSALGHFADIEQLNTLFTTENETVEAPESAKPEVNNKS